MAKTKAILIDITKCIGCRSCEQACKQIHGFPMASEAKLSPTALTVVEDHGDRFVRKMCMNCQEPACASACLVGALKKTELGPVTYEASKCIGCRYCIVACPFNVPRYEWTKLVPFVKKCDMCFARQSKGELPACVEACPVQASISAGVTKFSKKRRSESCSIRNTSSTSTAARKPEERRSSSSPMSHLKNWASAQCPRNPCRSLQPTRSAMCPPWCSSAEASWPACTGSPTGASRSHGPKFAKTAANNASGKTERN